MHIFKDINKLKYTVKLLLICCFLLIWRKESRTLKFWTFYFYNFFAYCLH